MLNERPAAHKENTPSSEGWVCSQSHHNHDELDALVALAIFMCRESCDIKNPRSLIFPQLTIHKAEGVADRPRLNKRGDTHKNKDEVDQMRQFRFNPKHSITQS